MGTREKIVQQFQQESLMEQLFAKLQEVCKPYGLEPFQFVLSALEYTQQKLPERRHVTGRELLDGIIGYAREQFGPMAWSVFEHWGIRTTQDFGNIVFKMVEAGVLSKTENDSLEDFRNTYDLKQALEPH